MIRYYAVGLFVAAALWWPLSSFSEEPVAETLDEKATVLIVEEDTGVRDLDETNCAEVFGSPPPGYASCIDWVIREAIEDEQAK